MVSALLYDSEILTSGLYISASTTYITKINFNNGDTSLIQSYPWTSPIAHLHRCADNGFIMLSFNAGNYDYIKIDSNFNMQWNKNCGMPEGALQLKPDPVRWLYCSW